MLPRRLIITALPFRQNRREAARKARLPKRRFASENHELLHEAVYIQALRKLKKENSPQMAIKRGMTGCPFIWGDTFVGLEDIVRRRIASKTIGFA